MAYKSFTLTYFMAFFLLANAFGHMDPNWCGNKHANLVKLQTIVQSTSDVEVPPFIGISTGRVEAFLRKHSPQIFKKYAFVVNRLTGKKTSLSKIMNAMTGLNNLSNEDILQQIQGEIRSCFYNHMFDFTDEESSTYAKWTAENQFCMVRSTGVEDSQTVANAGGNLSLAYVKPDYYFINNAMGEVIASYFGMQSLKNRIAGGEELSATDLCLPVLIQLLIGENIGGSSNPQEIPVSGVAFTTNQGLSAPNFSIAEINASYGHGEGIVANKVIADRYYVTTSKIDNSLSIYPMVYQKAFRLVPGRYNDHGLISIKNPHALMNKSALSESQITSLYKALKTIENSYGQPMDVEFVVVGPKIYIVQARPAMRHVATPSYLNFEKLSEQDISTPLQVMTLVPGNAQLQVITNPQDIIVANTLDDADQMPNNAKAKAVIVHAWASSLSHAAVNFISHGIPCLYAQNKTELSQLIAGISPQTPLIIDSQRRLITLWQGSKNIEQCTISGWFEHPIDRAYSCIAQEQLTTTNTTISLPVDARLLTLLDRFKKTQNVVEQKNIIGEIAERVNGRLALTNHRIKHLHLINSDIHKALQKFNITFDGIIAELLFAVDHTADHFEVLFYHKMLEALLFQESNNQLLGAYTYSYFLNDLFSSQTLFAMMRQAHANKELNTLISYAKSAPNTGIAQKWTSFLQMIEQCKLTDDPALESEIAQLKTLLAQYESNNCLSLWFATEFYQVSNSFNLSSQEEVRKGLSQLVKVFTKDSLQFMAMLQHLAHTMHTISMQRGNNFTKVTAIDDVWKQIKNEIVAPLQSAEFINSFMNAPLTLKINACQIMHSAIDMIDTTIKTVKSSHGIGWNDRIHYFKIMLIDFNFLCSSFLMHIMPREALRYHFDWPLSSYLTRKKSHLDTILFNSNDESMFQRSSNFSVNAAMLGSATAFERHYPETAEDIFMLIHQNSLMAVAGTYASLFTQRPLDEQIVLPELLRSVMRYCETEECINILQERNIQAPVRMGLNYTPEMIVLAYNMSLRNHSSTFQIKYNQATQQASIAVQFLGESRGRWEQIALLANLSKDISNLELLNEVVLDKKAGITSWEWIIHNQKEFELIMKYLGVCGTLSFERNINIDELASLATIKNFKNEIKRIIATYRDNYSHQLINYLMIECDNLEYLN